MNDHINYIDRIPNNVDLGRDRVLQRALEHWQPAYMGWWYDMGPARRDFGYVPRVSIAEGLARLAGAS